MLRPLSLLERSRVQVGREGLVVDLVAEGEDFGCLCLLESSYEDQGER